MFTQLPHWPRLDPIAAYNCYQQWRHRLPVISAAARGGCVPLANGLLDITDEVDVFVFDAFGVLNTGEQVIPGAAATVRELRARGKCIFVLSNGASNDRAGNLKKLLKMGFDFSADELVSSRDAFEQMLPQYPSSWHWGVAGRNDFEPGQLPVSCSLLGKDDDTFDLCDAFVFLSTADWSTDLQARLAKALSQRVRPLVIANPDLVAPFPNGFSIEPGFFGHQLADQLRMPCDNLSLPLFQAQDNQSISSPSIRFFGKPFADVFSAVKIAAEALGQTDTSRICMVGDTLHTDILGGQSAGWRTALVTNYGLFANLDSSAFIADSGIAPDWTMGSIGSNSG